MIEIYSIAKLGNEEPIVFELRYNDLEKGREKGYFLTKRYGTREQITVHLLGCGAHQDYIDEWFERVT